MLVNVATGSNYGYLNGTPPGPSLLDVMGPWPRYLFVGAGLVDSRGAARRAIKEGGAYVNNVRIESEDWEPGADDLLHGSWLVLRRGKKNFAGVKVNN